MRRYMTFGCGQMLAGCQIEIIGENEAQIRRAIHRNFGTCYCALYEQPSEYERLICSVDLRNCNIPEED